MQNDDIKSRIELLRKDIELYNYNYYNLNKSIISDYEFDKKLKELEQLENDFPQYFSKDSPTNKVGSDISRQFETKPHSSPMLSLPNAYKKEELIDFHNRVKKNLQREEIEYTCELKFDGAAVSIRYENGKIKDALTRGDGIMGDDITENVKTIKSVPLQLNGDYPNFLEIRGEVVVSKENFNQLNKQRRDKKFTTFSNPRNFASGSLKMLDSLEVSKRRLEFKVYSCRLSQNDDYQIRMTNWDLLNKLGKWGFDDVYKIIKTTSVDEILEFVSHWNEQRDELPFLADGVVIKVNDIDYQDKLGQTSKFPRWALAFKFDTQRKYTYVKDVEYYVGRTGAITPVAILDPIDLYGTIVKRASLHNFSFLEKFDLRKNDKVLVEKGGDIIPKIILVDTKNRDDKNPKIEHIHFCPSCFSKLYRENDDPVKYCLDSNCPDKSKAKIEHFISQKAMDIRNIGKETINQLFDNKIVRDISDIFHISVDDIIGMDRIAAKSANNIINSISKSKIVELNRFIYSLGIRHVGLVSATKLAKHFNNIHNIIKASYDNLLEVDEIGDRIAKSVSEYFNDDYNLDIIDRLQKGGLNILEYNKTNIDGKLNNKSFLISGVFKNFSRNQIKDIIEKNGGRNVSSISKKTNYLLIGDKPGKSKLNKAKEFNVSVIGEQDFQNMI